VEFVDSPGVSVYGPRTAEPFAFEFGLGEAGANALAE
jgi:hypothetical protein